MKRFVFILLLPIWLFCQVPDLTTHILMRDETTLPTDFYFPDTENRAHLPTVLIRSPSGRKSEFLKPFLNLTKAGYLVVVQSTRNVEDPKGRTFPFLTDGWGEQQDGYDTLEWLSKSGYTNGKVGTAGVSAMGITQLLLAPTAHPSLAFQHIGFAPASLYHHAIFRSGQVYKSQVEGWLGFYAPDPGVHSFVINQPFFNEFWKQFDTTTVSGRVQTPALFIAGWYDTFLNGTLSAFQSRQNEGGKGARGKQRLVIGPWTHFWPKSMHFGDFEIPPLGNQPPIDISPKPWFDFYLKGIENSITKAPPVTYFVMGPFDGTPSSGNVWKSSDVWPPKSKSTPFYLTKDHTLTLEDPVEGSVSFTYDPCDPAPTLGGRNLFLESGPKDQRPIEMREDVLVFTSETLTRDLEVTGQLSLKLLTTSDQDDTDIAVRLTDVYPDGKSILVSDGIFRIGHDFCIGKAVSPIGCDVTIDLGPTSMVFAKGHKIRLSVTGSNYPRFEKNLNIGVVGGDCGAVSQAETTIHIGSDSALILPIVE
ncbi:MAG: CocE/NonD family hydrolase [Waddliaceae bacterium]